MNVIRTALTCLIATGLVSTSLNSSAATNLTGAGGTFPAPVYARFAADYQKETGNQINYQGIGSSGGVKQITARTVDFGATDAPLSPAELNKYGLFQFPTVIGGVVLAVNLPGIKPGQLLLEGKTVADIYLGNIRMWNDPAIVKLNPNIKLPATNINVVRRADGSGTSFVFSSYLSKVSAEWQEKIGKGNTVNWPIGLGGKGNDGVAAFVQRLLGSIGYVEYAYAKQNNLTYTRLKNADNQSVIPGAASFKAAAKDADWNQSLAQDLTEQKGANAWPITSTTYILIYQQAINSKKSAEVVKFFDWIYQHGDTTASRLDYALLPKDVIQLIRAKWQQNLKDADGKALY